MIHNHPPFGTIPGTIGLPANHRRHERSDDVVNEIIRHTRSGLRVAASQSLLRDQFPEIHQKRKDISNIRQRYRHLLLSGKTIADATLELLQSEGFAFRYSVNSNGFLEQLLFVHPECLEIWARCLEIILCDNTYKIHRSRRPVFDFCGITGGNKTIPFGLCLLAGQDEKSYTWVFEQIKDILVQEEIPMPNLLVTDRDRACLKAMEAVFPEVPRRICEWHLLKDVLAYTRSTFEQEPEEESGEYVDNEKTVKWYDLFQKAVYTPEEAEFRTICLELKAMWPKGFAYLEKEWLPFTSLWATFRLKRIRTWGVRATSRIEGVYATIKSWLGTLQSDTYGLVERLLLYFRIQASKYWQELSEETSHTLIQMPRTFQSFHRKVYRYAIQEVLA